ncbi:MAG: pyridoxal phosphate-dependent aminotransferase [Candidatus Electryoneaceae bacterium]|nr:pyridoxal phosphate-dependent aminotransferase [Candidatus Electryoneaceae bacterium]
MQFDNVEMLDWVKRLEGDDLIDIASSGVPVIKQVNDLGLPSGDLPLWGDNDYGYVPLKGLLAERFGVQSDQVMITPGASMANFMVMSLLLKSGDRVIVESPVYRPLVETAEAIIECPVQRFDRRPENDYHLDPEELKLDPPPKLIILTNPHNPTGIYDSSDTFARFAEYMERCNGWVLVDEVFSPFMPDGDRTTIASAHNRVIATGGLTKVWGLNGLRIGWITAPAPMIRRLEKMTNYMHVTQPFITEYIAYKVLSDESLNNRLLQFARSRAKENLAVVRSFMKGHPQLTFTEPDGGITALVRFRDGRSSNLFCKRLLQEHRTVVMPGRFFDVPDGFRLGFGETKDTVERGLDAISKLLLSSLRA